MTPPRLSPRVESRLRKLIEIAEALPELEISGRERLHEQGRGAGHLRLFVRKKTVAYFPGLARQLDEGAG